jgi:threonine dehydrogenase-like Zn-dependent dehydrogenase
MGSPRIDLPAYTVSTEERTLVGSFCYSARDFRETAEWVGGAPDVLARLVDGRVDMAGAPEAFRELASGVAGKSKVLVFPARRSAGFVTVSWALPVDGACPVPQDRPSDIR